LYHCLGHLLSIFVPGIAVVWYCASQIENPTSWELLFVIPVLVFYNFNEWWLHRNAMHRPIKGLGGILMPVFHRHTHQHHQYFTARVMTYDSNREWRIVLFPPYALLVFMLLTPLYYLNYETFHLCCHVHDNWLVRNLPLVNTIRRHHAAHHSQPIMMERNMNLTYPVTDWYMGTSDLNRGLLGHLFNGYSTRYVKKEFLQDQGAELDAGVKPA